MVNYYIIGSFVKVPDKHLIQEPRIPRRGPALIIHGTHIRIRTRNTITNTFNSGIPHLKLWLHVGIYVYLHCNNDNVLSLKDNCIYPRVLRTFARFQIYIPIFFLPGVPKTYGICCIYFTSAVVLSGFSFCGLKVYTRYILNRR